MPGLHVMTDAPPNAPAPRLDVDLADLLDALDGGVALLDAAGRVRHLNRSFLALFAVSSLAEWQGRPFVELLQSAYDSAVAEPGPRSLLRGWRENFHRGTGVTGERWPGVPRSRHSLERSAQPIADVHGGRAGWIEQFRPVSPAAESHSLSVQTEKMAMLGQLVSGIAHELNNPLTTIRGYAQLLETRRTRAERQADAEKILQEAERASRIVRNLLLFARETRAEWQPVNINDLLGRTLELRSYELKLENISTELILDSALPLTVADPQMLQQVFLNLLVNAEHAILSRRDAAPGGRIRVATELRRGSAPHQDRIVIVFSDDGPGVDAADAPRLFEPFFTTKLPDAGTGLGLSIVSNIVEGHGGEVYLSSDGQEAQGGLGGATFVVEIPVHADRRPAAPGAPVNAPQAAAWPPQAAAPAAGQRLLVIEDEPTVAQLLTDVLREDQYIVETELDARRALERCARQDFALILCDLRMARMDGPAFLRELIDSGSPLRNRLVFVTGDTLSQRSMQFLKQAGVPYLAKPFRVEDLRNFVRQTIAAAEAKAAASPMGAARARHRSEGSL